MSVVRIVVSWPCDLVYAVCCLAGVPQATGQPNKMQDASCGPISLVKFVFGASELLLAV